MALVGETLEADNEICGAGRAYHDMTFDNDDRGSVLTTSTR